MMKNGKYKVTSMEVAEARNACLTKTLEDLKLVGEFEGFEVYKDNEFVRSIGSMFGATFMLFIPTSRWVIMVDEYFDQLSDNAKKFILGHEAGHNLKGHSDKIMEKGANTNMLKRLTDLVFKFKVNEFELEADAYATKFCDVEKALEELISVTTGITRFELKLRLKAIKKLK